MRVKALVDFGEDSSSDVAHEEEEEMEIHRSKHRKLTRAEKSKNAAKCRRDKEAVEFNNIIEMLPFPNDDLEKMDKSSVVKLTTSYFKMMEFIEKAMKSLAIKEDKDKIVCKRERNDDGSLLETETQESELMLEALDGFMILLDRKRHILFVSRNVEEHLGLSQVQLIGKSIEEFLEEKDIPELRKQFNLKFVSEASHSSNSKDTDDKETDDVYHQFDEHRMFYLRMLCQYKNNKTKYKGHTLVQWAGKLKMRRTHKANNFATIGLMCICKVMQTNSILEIKMDGNMFMSRHDLGMTFTFCDPRIITLIGYEPSEVIGRTAYQFHNPLDAERVRSCHSNLIIKGSSVSKYYRFVGKNCDWVWMQTRATIIYNTSNKPQYIVCMNYIISEEEGIRVFMEEDKESLCCTGVMDISSKPFKPINKGDNHEDNGYHSGYSPYSSINASPLSDDCGASVGDTNDDFPMSVVQECASSLDPDANDNEEMRKFIESLDGDENEMEENNQVLDRNVLWNSINPGQLPSNYKKKQSLQRIKSCPHVISLLPNDNELDDQPIEFMCKSPDNSGVPNNGNGSTIPKQGLLNIQIGSFNDGSLIGSSAALSETLPKDISEFCLQYAESMASMQSQDIISQYAQDNFYTKLDSMGNQSQSGQASCQSFNLNGLGSPGSPQSFGNQQSFTNRKPVLPNTQQSSYPTSPQTFYTRSSDTPNSYLSGSNVSSPQTSYSNLNSPLSVDTNMASPASDFSTNIRSPIPQAQPCSIGMNNLTLNSARSLLMQSPVKQASTSQHQASFPSQKINGNMILDRNMLLKLNSVGNMSQPNGGSRLVNNNKVRTSGLSLCNNRPVLVRMANQQQNCSQGRTTQNNVIHNSNSGIKSTVTQKSNNPPKGLRNVKSMSELEKMLRGYSPPFLQEKDGKQSGNESGCPLLQQMLTGKLSGEKYIAMEKQRQLLNSAIRTSHP